MKILELPLKKEWYDMIESGEKREEKQRKITERKKLLEDKKAAKKYEVARKCFMGMVLSDGKVVIKVLPTVNDRYARGRSYAPLRVCGWVLQATG